MSVQPVKMISTCQHSTFDICFVHARRRTERQAGSCPTKDFIHMGSDTPLLILLLLSLLLLSLLVLLVSSLLIVVVVVVVLCYYY